MIILKPTIIILDHPQKLYVTTIKSSFFLESFNNLGLASGGGGRKRDTISNLGNLKHHRHPRQIESQPQNESGQTLSAGGG